MERVLPVQPPQGTTESDRHGVAVLDRETMRADAASARFTPDDTLAHAAPDEWDGDDCLADGRGDGDLIFGDEGTAL